MGKTRHTELIEKKYNDITDGLVAFNNGNTSLMQFSDENPASDPHWETDIYYFHSPLETLKIFKSISNKKSAGTDDIPNIVLKHLPFKTILDYNILFNNCLNNCYFPKVWKVAKVVPIRKKGKDPTEHTLSSNDCGRSRFDCIRAYQGPLFHIANILQYFMNMVRALPGHGFPSRTLLIHDETPLWRHLPMIVIII